MVSDLSQYMALPDFRINAVQSDCYNKVIHCYSAFTTAVSTGKQEIATPSRNTAQRVLGSRIIDLNATVIAITCERRSHSLSE